MEFGERLKKVRKEKGVEIKELAMAIGISESLLLKVENGEKQPRFSYPVIKRMAEILDVEIDRLIDIQVG